MTVFKVGDRVSCYDPDYDFCKDGPVSGVITDISGSGDLYSVAVEGDGFNKFCFYTNELTPEEESTMIVNVQTNNTITVFEADGTPHSIDRNHSRFNDVKTFLNKGNTDINTLLDMMSPVASINKWGSDSEFTCDGQSVYYKGNELHGSLISRILQMIAEGRNTKALQNFMERLYKNPSFRSVDQLYDFLANNSMGITEDGYFLAYRVVTGNYRDKHTWSVDNSPGQSPRMDRNQVDDDPNRTCSYGYHVCSMEYAKGFFYNAGNDRVVSVKVDPADVVSVPVDYNNSKMRVCGYTVLADITSKVQGKEDYLASRSVWDDDSYLDEDYDWNDDSDY